MTGDYWTSDASIQGKILALTGWAKNTYGGEGYAIIAVHKDLNSTVWFEVWGMTGQDTYYATWWLWNNVYYLDSLPMGVTALILELDYSEHPVDICAVEALGTISETYWDCAEIHLDP